MIGSKTPMKNTSIFESKVDAIDDIKKSLDDSDLIVISKLNSLRNSLNGSNVNIPNVKKQIEELSAYKKRQNFDYLQGLCCPEKAKGGKIPSQIPVPSCSFQLHNSITLTTNASGNVAFFMNPVFLASENAIGSTIDVGGTPYTAQQFLTSAWINNDDSLTGNASNDKWVPVNFGQTLPEVYDQYRLVSAAVTVKYIGRIDIVQGVIGGAIFYDECNSIGGYAKPSSGDPEPTKSPELSKYGYFDYAQDAFYSQQNMTLEGVRMLYFPLDNSYEEYIKILNNTTLAGKPGPEEGDVVYEVVEGYYKNGFNWFFWASGAPTGPCFKVDIYCNFECLPTAKFLNYMPITVNPCYVSSEEKKRWIMYLQSHPIMKADETIGDENSLPDIFIKLMRKFKNGLPCFEKLRAWGLIQSIPSLKPGLALAGTMLASDAMNIDNCC